MQLNRRQSGHRAKTVNHAHRRMWLLAAATATAALPAMVFAQQDQWIGGTSDWNNPANWSTAAVPGAGNFVDVTSAIGLTQTITYDYPGPNVALGTLIVDLTNATPGSAEILSIGANTLQSSTEDVGLSGAGVINQSGGTNYVGTLYIANGASSTGTYILSGSGTLSAGLEVVGQDNVGNITQSGGDNFCTTLDVGQGGSATYVLTGGYLGVSGTENINQNSPAPGIFNQSGGTNACTTFNIYSTAGGYDLSGGQLLVYGNESLNGVQQFNQTGGSNVVNGTLAIDGALNLSGGILSAGYIIQTGGTFNSALALTVGLNGNALNYTLNNGLLAAPALNLTGGTFSYSTSGGMNIPVVNQSGGLFTRSGGSLILGGTGGPVAYNISGGTLSAGNLYVGSGLAETATLTISGIAAVTASPAYIGYSGVGVVNQISGSVSFNGVTIGENQNGTISTGVYNLSGGVLTSNSSEYIGYSGIGVFNQTGGSNISTSSQSYIAAENGANGTYYQSGGVNQVENLVMGEGGIGAYVLSAGTLQINEDLYIGDQNPGYGTFNQSGGTTTAGFVYVGYESNSGTFGLSSYNLSGGSLIAAVEEYVGYESTPALFTQSGGVNSAANFDLGSATFTMTNGSLIAGIEYLGNSNSGSDYFNQSGGTNTVNSSLYLGYEPTTTVSYTLSGTGALVASTEYLGFVESVVTFNQSGGTNTLTAPSQDSGILYLAYNSSTNATYALSGAAALSANDEYIGGNGTANFVQSGGANNAGSSLLVAYNSDSTATYTLSGGTLSAATEFIGYSGRATFSQSGGSNMAGSLYLSNSGGASSYLLSGNAMLSVANTEVVGVSGSASFNQTGGANTAGELDIAQGSTASGTYQLSGGTLTASTNVYVGGSRTSSGGLGDLTVSGGTLSAAGISIYSRGSLIESGGAISANLLNIGGLFNYQSGPLAVPTLALNNAGTLSAPSFLVGASQSLIQTGGLVAVNQLSVLGSYNYQFGFVSIPSSLTVDSGGSFSASSYSLTVSNGHSVATPPGSGPFSAGSLILDGGAITLSELNVATSGVLQATQGGSITLLQPSTVSGIESLDGGTTLTGPNLEVASGGLLSLGNAIVSPSLTIDPGGELLLNNSLLSNVDSLAITNNGTIDGAGRLIGTLTNNGDVNAGSGQSLTFTAAGNVNGTSGLISLTGGALHFTQDLTNEPGGQISGYGTLRVDGGLTNLSGGSIALGGQAQSNIFGTLTNSGSFTLGGLASVFGSTTNNAAFQITGTSPNVFYGAVNNPGAISVTPGASVLFLGAYTGSGSLSNGGATTFEAGAFSAPITGSGSLTIGVAGIPTTLRLTPGGGGSSQSSLMIATGSTLDLTNNNFYLDFGSAADPVASIFSYLQTGYDGGAWTGAGITSSTVAALDASQTKLVYALGYADGADNIVSGLSSGQIEIMPTLAGDAKLENDVVFGDFQLLAQYFGTAGTWDEGNFTYGPTIDFGDFQLLAQDFGDNSSALTAGGSTGLTAGGSAGLTAGELASLDQFAAEFGESLMANPNGVGFQLVSVPEPASLGLLAASGIGLLARRRRGSPRKL